jgi:hypothetical protein
MILQQSSQPAGVRGCAPYVIAASVLTTDSSRADHLHSLRFLHFGSSGTLPEQM